MSKEEERVRGGELEKRKKAVLPTRKLYIKHGGENITHLEKNFAYIKIFQFFNKNYYKAETQN